jgi:hypothetical protein
LGVIGIRVICERLLALQLEDIRRQRDALRIPHAPIQINHNAHRLAPSQPALRAGQRSSQIREDGADATVNLALKRGFQQRPSGRKDERAIRHSSQPSGHPAKDFVWVDSVGYGCSGQIFAFYSPCLEDNGAQPSGPRLGIQSASRHRSPAPVPTQA